LAVPFFPLLAVLVALGVALVVELGLALVADQTLRLLLAADLAAVLPWFPFQSVFVLVLLEIRLVEWEPKHEIQIDSNLQHNVWVLPAVESSKP